MLDQLERELERLRAYRSDVPEPDAATVAAARLELMEAVGREPRPATARGERGPRASRSLRSRAQLRRLQRRRRFALAGGLATVGVAVAGVLGLTTAATPVSALAAQMNQLAKVAASQDWTGIPGPGQYLYTESEGLTEADTGAAGKECVIQLVDHRQIWRATDGSGALHESTSDGHFTSAADASVCASMHVTASSEDVSGGNRYPAGGLSFLTNDWKSFSTDPATLLKQVHQRDGGPDTPAEWFVNVGDFMRETDVPPAIRAALYKAAALIPGVQLLGAQTDPTGQTGLGVGYDSSSGYRSELIFDQQSGRLLAEEYFDPSGKLTEWTAYTAQRIVDALPNYPMSPNTPSSTSSRTSSAPQGQTTTTTAAGTATSSTPVQAPSTATTGAGTTTSGS